MRAQRIFVTSPVISLTFSLLWWVACQPHTCLEYGRQAEKVVLNAVDLIREIDPKAAQELLEHPDYINLLITRSMLEAHLKELELGA